MIYQIWLSSCTTMEGASKASFIESVEANSFQEACDKCKLNRIIGDEDPIYKGQNLYNSSQLTYWGLKLYDNERDANDCI